MLIFARPSRKILWVDPASFSPDTTRLGKLESEKKLRQNIVGYDCNALYLWAIGEDMPGGYFVRRQGPDFKPKVNKTYLHMFAWMDKEAESKGIQIQHLMNTGQEYRIGPYLCNGYDHVNKTV